MRPEQQLQEEQYALPYHYLPNVDGGVFSQHAYWSWGFRYLGGMLVAQRLCDAEPYESLLDLGCGDGRFLREMQRRHGTRRLVGVDYSSRSIGLARAMNPTLDYRVADIGVDELDGERFDVITAIEVIEHIPPDDLPVFVERAVSFLRPGGRFVITVPHRNKALNVKHFQHFDSGMLRTLLEPHLDDLQFQPFDFPSRRLQLWQRLIGRAGNYFIVTWRPFVSAFYKFYLNRCLYGEDETKCGRIACVGRRPREVT